MSEREIEILDDGQQPDQWRGDLEQDDALFRRALEVAMDQEKGGNQAKEKSQDSMWSRCRNMMLVSATLLGSVVASGCGKSEVPALEGSVAKAPLNESQQKRPQKKLLRIESPGTDNPLESKESSAEDDFEREFPGNLNRVRKHWADDIQKGFAGYYDGFLAKWPGKKRKGPRSVNAPNLRTHFSFKTEVEFKDGAYLLDMNRLGYGVAEIPAKDMKLVATWAKEFNDYARTQSDELTLIGYVEGPYLIKKFKDVKEYKNMEWLISGKANVDKFEPNKHQHGQGYLSGDEHDRVRTKDKQGHGHLSEFDKVQGIESQLIQSRIRYKSNVMPEILGIKNLQDNYNITDADVVEFKAIIGEMDAVRDSLRSTEESKVKKIDELKGRRLKQWLKERKKRAV